MLNLDYSLSEFSLPSLPLNLRPTQLQDGASVSALLGTLFLPVSVHMSADATVNAATNPGTG